MAKILSIEVGYSLTRICEMDYKAKNPKVYKYVSIPTPEGVIEDGFLTDNAEFAAQLKKTLVENKIKTKQAVFSVTSSKIATREVTTPAVKMSQMDALVKANASDYFPIDLTEYELAHLVLGVVKGEDKADRYKVLVMAAEKKLVEGYEKLAMQCGLHLMALDYSGNSVYQIMKYECKEDTEMIIKVEERSTMAMVVSGQNLVLQRNVVYGVDDAVQTLMRSAAYEESTYEDALALMKRKTCIKVVLNDNTKVVEADDEENESENVSAARREITFALAPLINNIARVVDLYNSKNMEHPIKKVRLVGLGGDFSGLSKLFTNELGISTAVMNNLEHIAWNRSEGEGNPGRYIASIGAAFAPVGFVNEEKKKSDLKDVNYKNVSILFSIFVVVTSAAISMLALTRYYEAKDNQTRLQRLENEYLPAETVYNQYNNMTVFYNEVYSGYRLAEHPNDNLIAFLGELEEKLPADALLTEFTSNSEQAVLNMQVADKEQAAKVIETLRGFDSLMSVSVTGIAVVEIEEESSEAEALKEALGEILEDALGETGVEAGENAENTRVEFSIVCTYYPVTANNTTAAAAAAQ